MNPAVIWGFGQLGAALATAIKATGRFHLVAVIDPDAGVEARAGALEAGRTRFHPTLAGYDGAGPVTIFHATTSSPTVVMEQVLAALSRGHSVVSAAEWLFHPWLRFGSEAVTLDTAARRQGAHVLGVGINPGFCFESLPLLLLRTVHGVRSIEVRRMSDVGGIGPSDFAHLGFGLDAATFAARVADGSIDGHMGFPESIAALAERVPLSIDRITDRLEPTLAVRPLDLPYRTIQPGQVVGITQTATGSLAGNAAIRFTLDMFLDPAGYGHLPREEVVIEASRSVRLSLQPAAPPAAGAAAMMVHAAAALQGHPPGLVNLLDLPLGGGKGEFRLRAEAVRLGASGTDLIVSAEARDQAALPKD